MSQLYFPAFDTPVTNHGIADGLDGEHLGQLYGQLRFRNFTFTGVYGRRERDVPTASFGTVFNEQRSSEQTTDRHTLADVEYGRSFGATHVVFRGSFDQFTYDGIYPYATLEPDDPVVAVRNSVLGNRWTVGARATRALRGRQLLTAGVDFIDNVHQDQESVPIQWSRYSPRTDRRSRARSISRTIKFGHWPIANGGLR